MDYLDLTFSTPAENLACDEALLDSAEAGLTDEVLRVWETDQYFVVVGYANRVAREVNLDACRLRGIPVHRRCSGGGAVVIGPGCLNYSLILRIREEFGTVAQTNRFVLERNCAAVGAALGAARRETAPVEVTVQGITDLAIGDRKFSGNSQRRRRRFLLFHGTFLLNFDIRLVDELLPLPSRQPDYRRNRAHSEFLTNLGLAACMVKAALRNVWGANTSAEYVPTAAIRKLAAEKYSADSWNFKL
ncbi:MAG: lipoate--protein ligase family protein [Verrucomicrobiae bacterium]|nr:lipoate--protein ligase family protein [Verrucomicrobiae bacterium]MDW7981015.1 hypothetical protein [Verrucomicrobiales bacterium]